MMDTRLAQTVPGATSAGVVNADDVGAPNGVMTQVPVWVEVPYGSCDVLAIATPVSYPAWLVTKGYNKCVAQAMTLNRLFAVLLFTNLGTGTVLGSATKSLLMGAKEALAVATGPIAGEPAPGLAI